jgi:predicted exporter
MPSPRTLEQKLLVNNIGESPASRLLLLAIGGDQPGALAGISKRLAVALGGHEEFGFVVNGAQDALEVPE